MDLKSLRSTASNNFASILSMVKFCYSFLSRTICLFISFKTQLVSQTLETLHQIFIDLTLKTEQAEYVREGIKWEPVQYIDNKPVVELINGKPFGVLAILDEECLFPKGDDTSYCVKMSKNLGSNPSYQIMGNTAQQFTIKHYAGSVSYAVEGFLDKNSK